jgi:galactonate dehydratase
VDSTIVRLTTIHVDRLPNQVWLEIATADGRVGLGETYGTPAALTAWVHEVAAPTLLGANADHVERHWWSLFLNWGPPGIGVEGRGISMVDVALWDLLGKRAGLPLVALLGGPVRADIRAYNTCGGPEYGEALAVPGADLTGIQRPGGQYEDLWAFRHEADRLAQSLLDQGFDAMKIWPFDEVAEENGGRGITNAQIERGLEPIRRIRAAVGDRIDVAIELHGRWDVASAKRIATALEPYAPMWIEDPVAWEDPGALAAVASSTRIPVLAGEAVGSFQRFGDFIDRSGVTVVMADPAYVGGLTAAHRVADLAGQRLRAYTSHDCNGPVNLAVGVHLGLHAENASLQEMVRAYYFGWYAEFVVGLPAFVQGRLSVGDAPGHGVSLRPEVARRPDAHVRTSGSGGPAG